MDRKEDGVQCEFVMSLTSSLEKNDLLPDTLPSLDVYPKCYHRKYAIKRKYRILHSRAAL
jgi:hypothetical protein